MSKMTMPKFGPSEMFRLRHSLAGLVEELKFQKKCELDNESKIQELVDRNHALHKEWDTERQKARLKEEEFERAISELKLKYENKLRRLDIDRRQKNMKNECNLFAKDRMKEDMRQLQMTVFHQEKTIKELETKLQSLETSRETALCQWTGVEEKIANLSEIYQHTLDSVQRLQRDGKYTLILHCLLSTVLISFRVEHTLVVS
ncbi:hypothetical protein BsWGS_24576 [Bradybaena similaris]